MFPTQNDLDWIDLHLTSAVYHINQEHRKQRMTTPISRLREKLSKASGVAQRVATNIEAEADSLIAQEDAIKANTVEAFAPHKAILAEANTELQAIKDALNLMSNGGPPLSDATPYATAIPTISPPGSPPAPTVHDDTGTVLPIKLANS